MSEAKDWAGELISGQTGTGRILVKLSSKSISDGTGTQYWLLNPTIVSNAIIRVTISLENL